MPQLIESESTEYELFRDKYWPDSWRVEATDYENDCEVYIVIFTGSMGKERAEEYFAWKSQQFNR